MQSSSEDYEIINNDLINQMRLNKPQSIVVCATSKGFRYYHTQQLTMQGKQEASFLSGGVKLIQLLNDSLYFALVLNDNPTQVVFLIQCMIWDEVEKVVVKTVQVFQEIQSVYFYQNVLTLISKNNIYVYSSPQFSLLKIIEDTYLPELYFYQSDQDTIYYLTVNDQEKKVKPRKRSQTQIELKQNTNNLDQSKDKNKNKIYNFIRNSITIQQPVETPLFYLKKHSIRSQISQSLGLSQPIQKYWVTPPYILVANQEGTYIIVYDIDTLQEKHILYRGKEPTSILSLLLYKNKVILLSQKGTLHAFLLDKYEDQWMRSQAKEYVAIMQRAGKIKVLMWEGQEDLCVLSDTGEYQRVGWDTTNERFELKDSGFWGDSN